MVAMTTRIARQKRKPYQVRPTYAGITTNLYDLQNACVPYATKRMFPFVLGKDIRREFHRLHGNRGGLDYEEKVKFWDRLGVSKYITWYDFPTKNKVQLRDLTHTGERMMVVVRNKREFHITFIREDGVILDTEPTPLSSRALYAFLIKKDKKDLVYRKIIAWEKKYAKTLAESKANREAFMAKKKEQISIMRGRIARHERAIMDCKEFLEKELEEAAGLLINRERANGKI